MDLRHNQLPWSDQIWAKINADLAQALAQSRRVRAPFEVFHVPSSTQTVMADARDPGAVDAVSRYKYSETETLPVVELWAPFEVLQSQVQNEGEGFFALDRVIEAAHEIGFAEDMLLMYGSDVLTYRSGLRIVKNNKTLPPSAQISNVRTLWDGLKDHTYRAPSDNSYVRGAYGAKKPVGLELFNTVVEARKTLRSVHRYEPYALFLSSNLEGALQSTVPGSNSLNTPIERMRPLVTAGIHTTPVLPDDSAIVVSVARAWVDIAQAMEPSVQFLRIGSNGQYEMRLVERFAFRLKDRTARCAIYMNPNS